MFRSELAFFLCVKDNLSVAESNIPGIEKIKREKNFSKLKEILATIAYS